MTTRLIHDHEIEQRAHANARAEALRQLQQEAEADAQRDAQARAANAQQAQAMLAQLVQRWRNELAPLYARRAELLAQIAPALDELLAIEQRAATLHNEAGATVDQAARLAQCQHADVVRETRAAAGLPAAHDALSECPALPDFARVLGRALAAGLIGPNGIGHPSMKSFMGL